MMAEVFKSTDAGLAHTLHHSWGHYTISGQYSVQVLEQTKEISVKLRAPLCLYTVQKWRTWLHHTFHITSNGFQLQTMLKHTNFNTRALGSKSFPYLQN